MLLQVLKDVLCSGNYTYKRDFEGLFVFNRAVFVQLLNPHYDYDLYIYICIINIYIYVCVCIMTLEFFKKAALRIQTPLYPRKSMVEKSHQPRVGLVRREIPKIRTYKRILRG